MIKVNASAVSHILNGRSKPGFDVLDRIAQAFPEVNLNWLISGKGTIYNSLNHPVTKAPVQQSLLKEEEVEVQTPPLSSIESSKGVSTAIALASLDKKIKRIILFFEDGKFEDYEK